MIHTIPVISVVGLSANAATVTFEQVRPTSSSVPETNRYSLLLDFLGHNMKG